MVEWWYGGGVGQYGGLCVVEWCGSVVYLWFMCGLHRCSIISVV